MIYLLPILLLLYFAAAPSGLASFLGHLILVIASLFALQKLSRFYIFWFLAIFTVFALEPRFSFEYFLFAASMFAFGSLDSWSKLSVTKRKWILAIIFLFLAIADYSKLVFYERGSLLLWLPVFLALYAPLFIEDSRKLKLPNVVMQLVSACFVFLGNKKSTLVSFLALATQNLSSYLQSKSRTIRYSAFAFLFLALTALFFWSFSFQGTLHNFWTKSILARLNIWHACLYAAFSKLMGHGFGTFAIDFPIYRVHGSSFGAKIAEHVAHGHSLLAHFIFEQGLVGIFLLVILFYCFWRFARAAFWPFVLIAVTDSTLVFFNQYLLAGLILLPYMIVEFQKSSATGFMNFVTKKIPSRLELPAKVLLYFLALLIFAMSLTGHYFYDQRQFDQAIKYDPYHSLYHFVRGAISLNTDPVRAEIDLTRAVQISPNISYYYGFLAAANLVNAKDLSLQSQDPQLVLAKTHIDHALKYDGGDAYWFMLASFINYQEPLLAAKYKKKALNRNPEIAELLTNPNYSASEFIGKKGADVRVSSFYRRGPRVYLPLAYIE